MNSSLKYTLIFVAVVLYLNAGWALGYYWAYPELVTSTFAQTVLNPLGVKWLTETYSVGYQISCTLFGIVTLLIMWLARIFELLFLGGLLICSFRKSKQKQKTRLP